MEPSIPKKRWRPRLRFSLRAMLIAMTVVCLFLGYQVQRARVQRNAVAGLSINTMDIMYDWECAARARSLVTSGRYGVPPGPDWLRNLIGGEYFQEVQEVRFQVDQDTDPAVFGHLANLPQLQELAIYGPYEAPLQLEGLDRGFLANLRHLESLALNQLKINDTCMQQIGERTSLRSLYLDGSVMTAEGIRHLVGLSQLETLDLSETQTDDEALIAIGQMHGLKDLRLDLTDISDAGIAHLQPLTELEQFSATGDRDWAFAGVLPRRVPRISLGDDSLRLLARYEKLEELRIGTRGEAEPRITGDGLAALAELPLTRLILVGTQLQMDDLTAFKKLDHVLYIGFEEPTFSSAEFKALGKQLPKVIFVGSDGSDMTEAE